MNVMRIKSIPRGRSLTIYVNGREIEAYELETVHAALLAAGILKLRDSGNGMSPRGIFCGMGTCYECLVTVNGQPNQRACQTLVEDQMEIVIDAE
jgi:sarcosine oxidase subunit alpha